MSDPVWLAGVSGTEVLPLIEEEAPVIRVEAPPGAGKTFGLSKRVVRILHATGRNESADQVLVVAFNRVIASGLRDDITSELSRNGLDEPPKIQTLHAFCQGLLGVSELRLLLPHERESMLYDVLHQNDAIRERFGRHSNAERALAQHEAGHAEDFELWNACGQWLTRHRGRLISDVPGELLSQIRAGDHAAIRFKHVIVDEFQDLTPTEQEIVARLRSTAGTLVALGDRRQSIYRFRGNDRSGLDNLAQLTGVEPYDVPMPTCRRCPAEIVDAANNLMAGDGSSPIESASKVVANAHLVHFKTPASEAKGMAKAIAESLRNYSGDRHLAIVPRRRFGFALRDELLSLDPQIRIDLSFSESILELWPVRESFLFFSLICDPDPLTWRAWFSYQRADGEGSKFKAANRNADAYLRFLDKCNDQIDRDAVARLAAENRKTSRGAGGTNLWDRAARFIDLADAESWADFDPVSLIHVAFDPDRWVGSGATNPIATHDLESLASEAQAIYADAISESPELADDRSAALARVLGELRYLIATREPLGQSTDSDLQITTLWGAKGLTADHVYVLGLCQAALPGAPSEDYPGTDAEFREEQRRLFFVALTRTKRTLVLSRPEKIRFGEAQQLGLKVANSAGRWITLPQSEFLRPVQSILPDSIAGDTWDGPWA